MLANRNASDPDQRKAVAQIARSLEEIAKGLDQANMKLDHLIETYGAKQRTYAGRCPYDPFRDTCEE